MDFQDRAGVTKLPNIRVTGLETTKFGGFLTCS
jgi:hypothetical protein